MTLSKKKKPAAASSVVSGEALGMDANIAMLVKERNANNAWHKLARNKTALVGFFIVAFMVVIAVFAHDKRMNDCLPPILFSAIFKLLKVLPDTELDAC